MIRIHHDVELSVQAQILQTLEEIEAYVESLLSSPDLCVQVEAEGERLAIILNVVPFSGLTYDSLADQLLENLLAVTFPQFRKLVLWGRMWGESDYEWQREEDLPIVRQHPSGPSVDSACPRLMPVLEKKYRNVLEELVADAVKAEILKLEDEQVRGGVKPHQVIAYALNRLQPMYATTEDGWLRMRSHAMQQWERISNVVQNAVQVVASSPRAEEGNIYRHKPRTSAQVLAVLMRLLGKNNLRWRDLPDALQRKLDSKQKYQRSSAVYEIRSYLKRAKMRQLAGASPELFLVDFGLVETDWFKVYMSSALGEYTNVLEEVVTDAIANYLARNEDSAMDFASLNLDEVMAYTLNRLPPMYATSEPGMQRLRQVALEQMQERIEKIVAEGIEFISGHPRWGIQPLPFALFEKELELALQEVRKMLDRADISWENLDTVLREELEKREITIPLSLS